MRIGVYGMGRFGYFWASILSNIFSLSVSSRNPSALIPPNCTRVDIDELGSLDLIFLTVSIRAIPEALRNLKPHLASHTTVADTASVKLAPLDWMQEILPSSVGILATHPMFGPESAKGGLKDLPLMVDPVRIDGELYKNFLAGISSLGLSVVTMTCDEHDRVAAQSQALTHFIGRSLFRFGMPDTPIATLWYRALQAVARQCVRDAPALFTDMQKLNPYAQTMRENIMAIFKETMAEIERGEDPQPLSTEGLSDYIIDVSEKALRGVSKNEGGSNG